MRKTNLFLIINIDYFIDTALDFADENPDPNRKLVTRLPSFVATLRKNKRLMRIAYNIEINTPMRSVIANPRTNEPANREKRMSEVIMVEKFESSIPYK